MEFSKEVLEKAQTQAWPDWSGYDLNKSNDSLDLMKAGGKKDLSKLVPVQKQITRNGKTVTQTVWVKPGSDEAKEAEGEKKGGDKDKSGEEKKGNEKLQKQVQSTAAQLKEVKSDKLASEILPESVISEVELHVAVLNDIASGNSTSAAEAFENVKEGNKSNIDEADDLGVDSLLETLGGHLAELRDYDFDPDNEMDDDEYDDAADAQVESEEQLEILMDNLEQFSGKL